MGLLSEIYLGLGIIKRRRRAKWEDKLKCVRKEDIGGCQSVVPPPPPRGAHTPRLPYLRLPAGSVERRKVII